MTYLAPVHMRVPLEKATKYCSIRVRSAVGMSTHRSGVNVWGSGKTSESICENTGVIEQMVCI